MLELEWKTCFVLLNLWNFKVNLLNFSDVTSYLHSPNIVIIIIFKKIKLNDLIYIFF